MPVSLADQVDRQVQVQFDVASPTLKAERPWRRRRRLQNDDDDGLEGWW